ncbi:hypothetical protein GP486_000653 [Trichoglossum hirsutum]|uniref:LSM domain-containing protein n=1 Tax=Trichoglossum hirsutum TaxID=265104 RepID=A0A9P8LID6_9PEZI|nr:hypothetical protein GP486_000653 [Trichoglossum hirsutum]
MEQLSLHDTPPPPGQNAHPPPPQPGSQQLPHLPQLPPQMFTTAAQLLDLTDTNLVLQDTVERIFVQSLYADNPHGVFIVRGENVLLLGEIDLDKEDEIPAPYQKAPLDQVLALQKKEKEERKRGDKSRQRKFLELGFEGDNPGEALL